MIYRMHTPGFPLSQFIEHIWFYEGYDPEHRMERLLPDGTVEVVIDLRAEPRKLYRRDDFSRHQAFKRSWISGKQSRYIVIESAPDSSMIGVHFRPGGTYPILGCPVSEITDRVIELDLVLGSAVNSLRDQIIEAPDIDRKFASSG